LEKGQGLRLRFSLEPTAQVTLSDGKDVCNANSAGTKLQKKMTVETPRSSRRSCTVHQADMHTKSRLGKKKIFQEEEKREILKTETRGSKEGAVRDQRGRAPSRARRRCVEQ